MNSAVEIWAKLHTHDAAALHERWMKNPDEIDDSLLDDRYRHGVWTVKSELELVRLIGGLQWMNPKLKLWYRGEARFHPSPLPGRFRPDSVDPRKAWKWLNDNADKDRAIRDRGPLARAAILQHYGCDTSLLDLTANYEVACAFACETKGSREGHVSVFALPRHTQPVTVFDEADVALVDLHAEMPSYCLRPHVQQAAFIARRAALIADITGDDPVAASEGDLSALRIAHIRLKFDGHNTFYLPRRNRHCIYPPESSGCRNCKGDDGKPHPAMMDGDFLAHVLRCLKRRRKPCRAMRAGDCLASVLRCLKGTHEGAPGRFPDNFNDAACR
ncbi:MAG: FRG domain-containing protein [Polyangiaceae bacterium]